MIKDIPQTLQRLFPFLLLAVWFLMQLPFLSSDPDTLVDVHTRGAWTDEGLYSGTARNFLNTGTIDPYENSLLTRGPLQTMVQIPVFFVFGQSLVVARSITLILIVFSLFLFLMKRETRLAGEVLLVAGFTQFHLFHFSHYAMAEGISTALILISVLYILPATNASLCAAKRYRKAGMAALMLFLAYGMKIQFLYVAALLPLVTLVQWFSNAVQRDADTCVAARVFAISALWSLSLALLYVVAWYLPNQEFYHYVMGREVDSRFPATLEHIWGQSRFNFEVLLFVPYLRPLIISGLVALLAGIGWMIVKPSHWSRTDRLLWLSGLLWLLLEIHKVAMTYMPHRYMVPAYAAIALMVAATASVALKRGQKASLVVMVLLALLAGWQLRHSHEALLRRTRDLQALNNYLQQYDWKGKTITGAWAPSATWGTKAKVYPVWYGFVNDERALDASIILAESDQEDSDRSLLMQGINLTEHTDSVRRFPVWRYQVDCHWIKNDRSEDVED
jgi:4-amino-4-deoxy-L-arabinose transferase-like glycosyltransferase